MTATGELRLGFVPLNDAAPLIVAREKGFFAAEGLDVALSREASWATIRDKVAAGALDGAHMLAPMVVAVSLGVGGEPAPMITPLALNLDGAALTVSNALADGLRAAGAGPGAEPLARVIRRRQAAGEAPLSFAVVFPYSMHNYLLRYWMAQAGIDPDRDVRLTVTPPPRMVARLAAGEIDAFCVGEPWNALAVAEGLGVVATRASQVWSAGPDKVFGLAQSWAERNPEALQALLRALLRAAAWADALENRAELAALLSRPDYVGVAAEVIAGSLTDIVFHRGGANAPSPAHAGWIISQMMRWGHVEPTVDIAAAAARTYRPDLYAAAAAAVGAPAPGPSETVGGFFDGRTFALEAAADYAATLPLSRLAPL
jgi:NitT/TauT family transport system ATP-binding protein/nitrate/nitrite transport system substrate-binding protein